MARALSKLGIEVEIATTDAGGGSRLAVPLGKKTALEGLPIYYFRHSLGESLKYSRDFGAWIDDQVRAYDLVHIHAVFSFLAVRTGQSASASSVPYVVRPMGALDPWSLSQHRLRKKCFLWAFARELLRKAAAIHYTTNSERRKAELALGLTHGAVIPLGVTPPSFRHTNSSARYLLALGRLHPKKRFDVLLKAFSRVASLEKLKEWQLYIAGAGDPGYTNQLKEFATRECAGRVQFLGWVEGEEKADLLCRAGLLVLPSSQENFGISAAEAMSAGVPVLLSREVDIWDDVLRSKAGWVTEGTSEAIAAALEEVLQSEAELRRRGDAARSLALDRFSWDAVGHGLLKLYSGILK